MLLPTLPCSLSPRKSTQRGFTLVETLLYLALFGIIMTNLAVLGFLLVKHSENSARNNGNLMEAGFIRDKLNYLVSTHIVVNSENETSQLVLQVPNQETSIRIDRVNDQLVIHDGSNKSTALSNPSYKITSLNFNLLNKRQMLVELDLNGQHYAFHQHLWTNSE